MPLTYLKSLTVKITRAIDSARAKESITEEQRQELYKSLFFLLSGDPIMRSGFVEFCKKWRCQLSLARLRKVVGQSVKLPQALHASSTKNVSVRKAQSLWKVSKSDLNLIAEIAKIAGVDMNDEQHLLRRHYSSLDLHWLAEVEDELEEVEIFLNNQALEDMLLGVLETYKVPTSKREPFSEVFGICLGMSSRQKITKKVTGTRTKWFVSVEKAVPQIRARASSDSVIPNVQSIEALLETATTLFPRLEVNGDYHSHPYRNVKALKAAKGWEPSPDDIEQIALLYRNLRENSKRKHRMRVTFIVAVAKGRSSGKPPSHLTGLPSVFHMEMAGCHLYVSAFRILSNGLMTNHGVNLVCHGGQAFFEAV